MANSSSSRAVEARAIYYAGIAAAVSAVVGLTYFWGSTHPLFGHHSIGSVASVMAALAAFCGFLITYIAPMPATARGWYRVREAIKAAALAFIYAAISLLVVVVTFDLAQNAFTGVTLDQWVSSLLVGLAAGICGYGAYLAGASLTTVRLSTSLALFLVSGVMASMLTASNPYWWQIHFSSLGGSTSRSALAFNLTLVMAGLVIVCLSDFVASDFRRLAKVNGGMTARTKVNIIRTALAVIGVLLACVGVFKYDTYGLIHALSAAGMALVFMGLLIGLPWIAPGFPKAFFAFSYGLIAAVIACNWLMVGVGYLNLTSFELICGAIIFAWVVVFVRNLAAAQNGATG